MRINETALNPFDKHLFNYNNLTAINFELYGEISYIMWITKKVIVLDIQFNMITKISSFIVENNYVKLIKLREIDSTKCFL